MFNDFLIPFLIIAISELGDKTQLAIFALSSKYKSHKFLFISVILAFFLTTLFAVFFGSIFSTFFSSSFFNLISGVIFLFFGLVLIFHSSESKFKMKNFHHPFFTSFVLVFLSEFGDKSQIATGLFTANFNQFFVFLGSFLALLGVSFLTILLGNVFAKKLNAKVLGHISGVIFILVSLFYFYNFIFI